ncbi:MAG: nitrogen regulation protein NR(II) [bacterium]
MSIRSDQVQNRWQMHAFQPPNQALKSLIEKAEKIGDGLNSASKTPFERIRDQADAEMTVGQMSAMISHEFRNALTSIKMILELQIESRNLNPSEKKSLSVALKSINHMVDVVTRLLNFSRPMPPDFQCEDLNEVVTESLQFVKTQLKKERITIQPAFDSNIPTMLLDAHRIKEALVNLLLNAMHALEKKKPAGGNRMISVATKRHTLHQALSDRSYSGSCKIPRSEDGNFDQPFLELAEGTECVLIEIKDNGEGINPEHFRHIFDPFYTTKSRGTGLGLAIVKQTINEHGGMITINSLLGQGTTIKLYLPLLNCRR